MVIEYGCNPVTTCHPHTIPPPPLTHSLLVASVSMNVHHAIKSGFPSISPYYIPNIYKL